MILISFTLPHNPVGEIYFFPVSPVFPGGESGGKEEERKQPLVAAKPHQHTGMGAGHLMSS